MSKPTGLSDAGLVESEAGLVVLHADVDRARLGELRHPGALLEAPTRRPRRPRPWRRLARRRRRRKRRAEGQTGARDDALVRLKRIWSLLAVSENLAEEVPGAIRLGIGEELLGVDSSTIWPSAMKTMRSAAERANRISWVTTIIVMPCLARSAMTSSTSLSSGSSAEVTSSNSITFGDSARRARWRRAAAGRPRAGRELLRFVGDADARQQFPYRVGFFFASLLLDFADLDRPERDVDEARSCAERD